MMYQVFPSLLAADLTCLGDEIERVLPAADGVHLDIMDHHYVPNLSFGPAVCKALHARFPKLLIDVHLMTSPVDALITAFAAAGAKRISIHPDATIHLDRSLQLIHDAGCLAGLALNPATPIDCITWCLHRLSFALVMTVNPGFGGQILIQDVIPKITQMSQTFPTLPIAVDGGVDLSNIKQLAQAGATEFIAGSAIFKSANYVKTLTQMRTLLHV